MLDPCLRFVMGGASCRKENLDVVTFKILESLMPYVHSITMYELGGIKPKITLEKMKETVFRLRLVFNIKDEVQQQKSMTVCSMTLELNSYSRRNNVCFGFKKKNETQQKLVS